MAGEALASDSVAMNRIMAQLSWVTNENMRLSDKALHAQIAIALSMPLVIDRLDRIVTLIEHRE